MGCTSARGETCGEGNRRRVKKPKTLESGSEICDNSNFVDEKLGNSKVTYDKKSSSKINRTFMTSTTKETNQSDIEDIILFPPGEHYYQLIKDFHKSKLIEKKHNLSERVELFFSLNNIYNPNNRYSFKISIINNKRIGNLSFLGYLKDGTGEIIEYGDSFGLDFRFEKNKL